ncbi:MAG: tRNA (adenosine(37)-N6)-dimethylallyltransferase MiaA [Candidatus Omnitrophica bacterium]|nr:tRNA (adenosine(37)-N6)-dimethylallyltransferase MiaA [Candidatus Omnitrophota bacterium]
MKPNIVFVLGPTGIGKSEFAVKLADRIKGEIISCDSMQVYKGMRIISQQPQKRLLKSARHHLIGFLDPSEEWSAADFVGRADRITVQILGRGKVPIVVGGTGLYARSFINGLFPSPPKDEGYRMHLKAVAAKKGGDYLYGRLLKIDPVYASKIHMNDARRIIRALEIYKLTGSRISDEHLKTEGIRDRYEIALFILSRPRQALYGRIDSRVEMMFKQGVAEEVSRLRGIRLSRTAGAVLGYKEIVDYLDGKFTLPQTKEIIKRNTRRYAKRQMTWFRKDASATWFNLRDNDKYSTFINNIADSVLKKGNKKIWKEPS